MVTGEPEAGSPRCFPITESPITHRLLLFRF